MKEDNHHSKITRAGILITLGIIFGDIGTSPLYVLKAVVGNNPINSDAILGAISCVFLTLTLQTTIKYVLITLRADNKGEGGIFSLYALVRRRYPSLLYAGIVGGSALLADGIITPPISVTSAIEGLQIINPHIPVVPIVIVILSILFMMQRFGTSVVGKSFGGIMLIWFLMLAILGGVQITQNLHVLRALNPYYAYNFIVNYPGGFWLLGAVFLCTTGAEALYSDLGHCGRKNIQVSWAFVKLALLLNYFGQGAWLMNHEGEKIIYSPFYSIMPSGFLLIGICIATAATVIASQALISGSYTLISEAMRLNFWPRVKMIYPTDLKGQIYIPSVNWILWIGCVLVVLYFRESSGMEAAYGLSITITMLMTTVLLTYYLSTIKIPRLLRYLVFVTYFIIEGTFLVANLSKFPHGGWVTIFVGSILIAIMWDWYQARKIKNRLTEVTNLNDYLPLLKDLSNDLSVPKYATHLVYMTGAGSPEEIESKVIYSIFQKQPKRADIYWFVHVDVVDEPYTKEYRVTQMMKEDVIRINFKLGFRVEPKINLYFRKVVEDMIRNKEVNVTSRYESLSKYNMIGDFRFVVIEKHLSYENTLTVYEKVIMDMYFVIKHVSLSEEKAFGLDTSNVTLEKFPLVISPAEETHLKRME